MPAPQRISIAITAAVRLVVCLALSGLVSAGDHSQVAHAQNSQRSSLKIAFLAAGDGRAWLVNEDGGAPTVIAEPPLSGGSIGNIRWSPDGRWLGFDQSRTGSRTRTASIASPDGDVGPELEGTFAGWSADSSSFAVMGPVVGGLGQPATNGLTFVRALPTVKPLEAIDRVLPLPNTQLEEYALSPRLRYVARVIYASRSLPPAGEDFVDTLTLLSATDGNAVVELSEHADGFPYWSAQEDKVAFYERGAAATQDVLSVWQLPDTKLITITDAHRYDPVLFTPDGKRLIYFKLENKKGQAVQVDLPSDTKTTLTGVALQYPGENLRADLIRITDDSRYLVFASITGGDTNSDGLFVHDLDRGGVKKLATGTVLSLDAATGKVAFALGTELRLADLTTGQSQVVARRPVPRDSITAFGTVTIRPEPIN